MKLENKVALIGGARWMISSRQPRDARVDIADGKSAARSCGAAGAPTRRKAGSDGVSSARIRWSCFVCGPFWPVSLTV
jgi:hypothetical protein